ncbi:MAG TPA: YIP1 family protein [Thermoanaerobaculia bacterium]|jgi:hypothetical protein
MHRLAKIITHPREVIRPILDQPRDRAAIWLVLAAAFVSSLGDANVPATSLAVRNYPLALVVAVSVGVIVVAGLVTVGLFYLFGWVTTLLGRLFDGTGKPRELRSALAWGVVPLIWSVLYRLPAAFFFDDSPARGRVASEGIVLDPGRFANGCGWAIVTAFLDLLVIGLCIWVSSNTIAEAHRFSSLRGLATYLLAIVSPLVVALAGILTVVF